MGKREKGKVKGVKRIIGNCGGDFGKVGYSDTQSGFVERRELSVGFATGIWRRSGAGFGGVPAPNTQILSWHIPGPTTAIMENCRTWRHPHSTHGILTAPTASPQHLTASDGIPWRTVACDGVPTGPDGISTGADAPHGTLRHPRSTSQHLMASWHPVANRRM